jgi:serine-type D-Ala-D-Ala carboxypeptidase/endopeptidase (penicillin-binding protein 4)
MEVGDRGRAPPALAWNDHQAVNPASLFKLLTTYAALDKLGPAWTWTTPVYFTGPLRDGVLEGSVAIQGTGDPKLVLERVWLMLRRLQQMGVREIRGDFLLDRSAFVLPEGSPADFDGEAHRPYNVRPDALLLNYKSFTVSFLPDPLRGVATVATEPALAGMAVAAVVPLAPGPCGDWRAGLKASLADPARLHFEGRFAGSCGEKTWQIAYADPASYNARLLEQLWREMGGRLGGTVRAGVVMPGVKPVLELSSPPLAELVRDINKFSNNVMAEQVFLTLGTLAGQTVAPSAGAAGAAGGIAGPAPGSTSTGAATAPAPVPGTPPSGMPAEPAVGAAPRPTTQELAREALRRWVRERWGEAALRELVVDNGSGLSREARLSADLLAQVLASAYAGPVMSELMSSLPVSGLDGTLRRSAASPGRAHLKTGSLRDVAGVAGYVLSHSGRRYVVVALLNHENANAGRPALDALVQWAIDDAPGRP